MFRQSALSDRVIPTKCKTERDPGSVFLMWNNCTGILLLYSKIFLKCMWNWPLWCIILFNHVFIFIYPSMTIKYTLPQIEASCLSTVLTCGWSCRRPGGPWRSHSGRWGCRGAPWRPWKSFCWPPTEPLWQTGQNRAPRPPSGRLQYLEDALKLRARE